MVDTNGRDRRKYKKKKTERVRMKNDGGRKEYSSSRRKKKNKKTKEMENESKGEVKGVTEKKRKKKFEAEK